MNVIFKKELKGIITSSEKKVIDEMYKDEKVQEFINLLKTFNLKYMAAMKETETKLFILNEDFKTRYNRTPIESIESRLKTPESLIKKMLRNNLNLSVDEINERIFDIAGVRVICSFISDIDIIVNMIRDDPEIEIIKEKDYINNPKGSGYRSYHMILKVPVYLTTGLEYVYTELQIRTMAMDFWASLEHKIKYKYDGEIPKDVVSELIDCSNAMAAADEKMLKLSNRVHNFNKVST